MAIVLLEIGESLRGQSCFIGNAGTIHASARSPNASSAGETDSCETPRLIHHFQVRAVKPELCGFSPLLDRISRSSQRRLRDSQGAEQTRPLLPLLPIAVPSCGLAISRMIMPPVSPSQSDSQAG